MREFDRSETIKIQSSLVRDWARSWIMEDDFYKVMSSIEPQAYKKLEPHYSDLLKKANIRIPIYQGLISERDKERLIEHHELSEGLPEDLHKISLLIGIKHKEFNESYGVGVNYDAKDFSLIFDSLSSFREIIPVEDFTFSTDYEDSTFEFLERNRLIIGNASSIDVTKLYKAIGESQGVLQSADKMVAHRDLDWSNIAVVQGVDGRAELQIVDWETFGLAYPGYDEGRLLTRLVLNKEERDKCVQSFLKYAKKLGEDEARVHLISFWRTVAIRSYSEMALIIKERYERPISYNLRDIKPGKELEDAKFEFKHSFFMAFEALAQESLDQLTTLFSSQRHVDLPNKTSSN